MRSKLSRRLASLLVCAAVASASDYQTALPGYRYQFPRDHFSHPNFKVEWWYYTGNLQAEDGHHFGFELTFFRQGLRRAPARNVWDVEDAWLAHFALSDLDGQRFYHAERLNRSGAELAGASLEQSRVWNGNWDVQWRLDGHQRSGFDQQQLQAVANGFTIRLRLRSEKPPVIQGRNGVSQKSAGAGQASHYISFTRLLSEGEVEVEGRKYRVTGTAWMDHEFFTHRLAADQTGWDWFSLQFADGTELMLYRLRRKDGSADPYSSGTWVDANGVSRVLNATDFELAPLSTWQSRATGGAYPIAWRIRVIPLQLELQLETPLATQELTSRSAAVTAYWEGAIRVHGTRQGRQLSGSGYLEMAGYAGAVRLDDEPRPPRPSERAGK